jgi:hypothetical protein
MRLAGQVACIGTLKMRTKLWLKFLKEINHSEDLGVDGILR